MRGPNATQRRGHVMMAVAQSRVVVDEDASQRWKAPRQWEVRCVGRVATSAAESSTRDLAYLKIALRQQQRLNASGPDHSFSEIDGPLCRDLRGNRVGIARCTESRCHILKTRLEPLPRARSPNVRQRVSSGYSSQSGCTMEDEAEPASSHRHRTNDASPKLTSPHAISLLPFFCLFFLPSKAIPACARGHGAQSV